MGETPKTALHRYSLLPTPCSLFPVPFAMNAYLPTICTLKLS
ncbi:MULTISPECIES: hypothetical protein [unclassified Moorena]|nr:MULTISPECIES: hypothetical protein [unclassified Moorena]